MEIKRSQAENKLMTEIRKDKTGRRFWEVVNEGRKKKLGVSDRITNEQWMNHFIAQFKGEKLEEKTNSSEDSKAMGQ